MKQATALDHSTATDRGYSQRHGASYIEKLLGKDGMQSAIFPAEEKKSSEAADTHLWIQEI